MFTITADGRQIIGELDQPLYPLYGTSELKITGYMNITNWESIPSENKIICYLSGPIYPNEEISISGVLNDIYWNPVNINEEVVNESELEPEVPEVPSDIRIIRMLPLTVGWVGSDNTHFYEIEYGDTVETNKNFITTNVEDGDFRIRAVNVNGESEWVEIYLDTLILKDSRFFATTIYGYRIFTYDIGF